MFDDKSKGILVKFEDVMLCVVIMVVPVKLWCKHGVGLTVIHHVKRYRWAMNISLEKILL